MPDKVVEIYIDPSTNHFTRDRLFAGETNPLSGDDILGPYIAVRDYFVSRGIPVHTADMLDTSVPADVRMYFSMGGLERLPMFESRSECIISSYFAMECPIVEPSYFRALPEVARRFQRIYSWSDSEALEPFVGERIPCEHYCWPQSRDSVHEETWSRRDRGFLVMINANKLPRLYTNELYTERIRAVEYFHRTGEIDLFGPNWTKAPRRVGKTWVPTTIRRALESGWEIKQRLLPHSGYQACAAATRGIADSKLATLGDYTFAVCFENQILKGWITEKIFDCLFAGTIPIYWGAPDVLDWIPAECFIDYREIGNYEALRALLHSLEPSEIDDYRDAGRAFVASERFDPFRRAAFIETFRRALREDANIDV